MLFDGMKPFRAQAPTPALNKPSNKVSGLGQSLIFHRPVAFSVLVGGLFSLVAIFSAVAKDAKPMLTYIGTYTGAKSKGIYLSHFDLRTGTLTGPELAAETKNPSFLALHPNHHILYSAGEVDEFGGKKGGIVSAFGIDSATGALTLINRQSSGGGGPCHLSVDREGKCVLVANYGGGSIAALPIDASGKLGEPATFIQHNGSSVNRQRQSGPHAHFITTDPANHFALACDLGL